MKIRTRFAPSPTGFLHIGGIRTALFNYLFAKNHGGQFILRLEDTDRERFVPEGVDQIVEGLDWVGLKPDEGFWISEGQHQGVEYVQSERHVSGLYQKYADELVGKGLAYYSPTSPEQLDQLREQARADKRPFLYRKELDPANSSEKIEGAPIRLDINAFFESVAKPGDNFVLSDDQWFIRWDEPTGRERLAWAAANTDDFIIIKGDGFPTYNFANVIDDHEMQISHVLRGDEFIASTPKHIILYHALGLDATMPVFVHLPVINGTDGKKLSKRTGDTNVLDYRGKGYLPEALLNFLVLLGWNDGTEQEIFSMQELIDKFSLERINTSPAVFDQKRLDWMNGHYIRQMDVNQLYEFVNGAGSKEQGAREFWPMEAADYSDEYKRSVLALVQERLKYFAELPELTKFFFTDLPVNPSLISDHKQLKKCARTDLAQWLEMTRASLEESDFSVDDLTNRLNGLLEQTGQKPAVLFSLIRIATTQAPASPGLAETLAILGKETTLRRLNQQLKSL